MSSKIRTLPFLLITTSVFVACGQGPESQKPNTGIASTSVPATESMPSFDTIAKKVGTLEAAGITFTVPEGWIEEAPRSSLRLAQYRLPSETEPLELAVFHFGPGQGGQTQDNIDRWVGQFTNPDDAEKPAESEVETFESNGLKISMVRASGTLTATSMGPMSPSVSPLQDQALWGLIIEGGPQGMVFVKVTGPEAAVKAQTPALEAFARSARVVQE